MPESKESIAYRAAYDAAKVADDKYSAECVRTYGRVDARWRKHTDASVIAARDAKIAADSAMHSALRELHDKIRS